MNAYAPIEPVETTLGALTGEINSFESRKTTQRKAELEAFVKKKEASVKAYTNEVYEAKRKAWRAVNERVTIAYNALTGIEGWKGLVTECICPERSALKAKQERYEGLLNNAKGIHERNRDKRKLDLDAARATLDTLLSNGAKADAWIVRNGRAAEDIIANLKHPDSAAAIYPMWFELLPDHRQLAAAEDIESCLGFIGEGETPDDLCRRAVAGAVAEAAKESGATEGEAEGETTPTAEAGARQPADQVPLELEPLHAVPWLVKPDAYSDTLNLAWAHYARARDAYEAAEKTVADFVADIAKTSKELDADRKSLAERVQDCLKEHAPEPVCK